MMLHLVYHRENHFAGGGIGSSLFKVAVRCPEEELQSIISLWGLVPDSVISGALIDTHSLTDMLIEEGATPRTLHYAIYCAHIAIQCKIASPMEMLGDEGFVHVLSHVLMGEELQEIPERCLEIAHWLETTIPGWPAIPENHSQCCKAD